MRVHTPLLMLGLIVVQMPQAAAQEGRPTAAPARTLLHSSAVRIPIIPDAEGRPAVTARINGTGPWRLRIDWGANVFVLSDSLARTLKLPSAGSFPTPNGPRPIVSVESVSLGNSRFEGLTAAVGGFLDASSDGVLGFNVFADMLMTFDFPGKTLVLEQGELPVPDGTMILPLAEPDSARMAYLGIPVDIARGRFGPQPHVAFQVGNLAGSAVMDTQAGGYLYLPDSLMGEFTGASDTLDLVGMGPQMGTMQLRRMRIEESLHVGGYTVERPVVTFRNRPGPILGMAFLGQFVVTLDQKNGRVRFKRDGQTFTPREAPWEHASEAPIVANAAEYAGDYGNRRVTVEEGAVFLQRTDLPPAVQPGRRIMAPRLALVPDGTDRFTIASIPEAIIQFVRDASGRVVAVRVRQRDGTWDESRRQ